MSSKFTVLLKYTEKKPTKIQNKTIQTKRTLKISRWKMGGGGGRVVWGRVEGYRIG